VARFLRTLFLFAAVLNASAEAFGAPQVAGQTPLEGIPGRIVALRDSVCYAVGPDTAGVEVLHRFALGTRAKRSYRLGRSGRGAFMGLSPDGRLVLASEKDTSGVQRLRIGSLPEIAWSDLVPVTDVDPHVTWFRDGTTVLYQDILDDSIGTPCVFQLILGQKLPQLFLFGCQRPLMSPRGDAIVCVGVDTLKPGAMRDVDQRQPVGLEDLGSGEFEWIAPLRTWIPTWGAWSPDGSRVALVGYGSDSAGAPERRLYLHFRATGDGKILKLTGDSGRPERDHGSDVAVWSPDGRWAAVGMAGPARQGSEDHKGGVWLVGAEGDSKVLLVPKEGTWRGAPLWTGEREILIADGRVVVGERGVSWMYWRVELEEER
jgi:hypothetical protein